MSVRTLEEIDHDWRANQHPCVVDAESRFYLQHEGAWTWTVVDRKSGLDIVSFPYLHLHEARGAVAALNAPRAGVE